MSVDFVDETFACRWCGRMVRPWGPLPRLRQHHVVFEQEVRRRGGDVLDSRNALALCDRCHEEHHSGAPGARRVPCDRLRDENVAWAFAFLGEGAALNYFARRYEGSDLDPRIAVYGGGGV